MLWVTLTDTKMGAVLETTCVSLKEAQIIRTASNI